MAFTKLTEPKLSGYFGILISGSGRSLLEPFTELYDGYYMIDFSIVVILVPFWSIGDLSVLAAVGPFYII